MKFHLPFFFLMSLLTLIWTKPLPTIQATNQVPTGLTPASRTQIQSQLAPEEIPTDGQQTKLIASDPAIFDEFGSAVAVSVDTAVIGAYRDDDGGNDSGSAYVFINTAGVWSQQAKLTASDPATFDVFGSAVAVSGDTAVIGAIGDDDGGTDSGSAYVFTRTGGVWNQQAKLTASDPAQLDFFGWSVAVSGDTAIIGVRDDDDGGSNSGSAYVFTRTAGVWSQQAKLTASDSAANDQFGYAVTIYGDTAVIGAYLDDDGGTDSGSAYVFTRTAGVWSQQAKLTTSDSAAGDLFGGSVALSGDTAVIGAYEDDNGGTDSGSAYVFTRTAGVWSQQAELTARDPAADDQFGRSVAVSGDKALIGARRDDDGGESSGSVYLFTDTAGVWNQQAKVTATDSAMGDMFGHSVAINNDTAFIGAPTDDDGGTNSGSTYVLVFSDLLTITLSGTGNGNVVSHPSGLDCGVVCTAIFITDTVVTLTATADLGSTFTGWSGDVNSTANPITVTINETQSITATFALNEYTIALSAEPAEGGTVTGGGEVTHGQVVTVTATAEAGYAFEHWTEDGDVVSVEANYSFTVTAGRTLVAHFVAITPSLPKIYLPLILR